MRSLRQQPPQLRRSLTAAGREARRAEVMNSSTVASGHSAFCTVIFGFALFASQFWSCLREEIRKLTPASLLRGTWTLV